MTRFNPELQDIYRQRASRVLGAALDMISAAMPGLERPQLIALGIEALESLHAKEFGHVSTAELMIGIARLRLFPLTLETTDFSSSEIGCDGAAKEL
jgi:hypothetical protein